MMPRNAYQKAIVAGLALAGVTIAFFWHVLFVPNTWLPAGGGDLVPFLYPNYHFAAEQLKQGHLPLWNPHLYLGQPFAADAQSGLFYPPNLLTFLLAPEITARTLIHLAIFHFWLAGWGMYLFLQHSPLARQLNLHPLAAFAGAVAFQFSDLFITHFGNLNMIAVAAWMPWVLLAYHHALSERSFGWAAGAGVLLGVATLASHIQITLFILLTMALLTLWHAAFDMRRRLGSALLKLITALGVSVGLAGLWLIPAIEMSRYSLRSALSYAEATAYALHPAQWIGLLIPGYFGRDPALHWGPWERVGTGYIGILTLALAAVAIVRYLRRPPDAASAPAIIETGQRRLVFFFVVLGGVSLLLALGERSILHGWLSLTPGFGQFRAPARYILLLNFGLATLASVGLHSLMGWSTWPETVRQRLDSMLKGLRWGLGGLLVISLPLVYFALLITQDRNPDIFRRASSAAEGVALFALLSVISLLFLHWAKRSQRAQSIAGAAIIIIALDLYALGAFVDVGHSNPTLGFEHPEAIAYLQDNLGLGRTEITTDIWHLWQPNTGLLHGLSDAWGLYNPLTLQATTRYWQGVGPRSSSAYNLLGVKYIVASKAGAPADGDIVPVFDADPAVNIYLNRQALARVLFVPQAQLVADHSAAWEALHAADFDPTTHVILEATAAPQVIQSSLAEGESVSLAVLEYGLQTVQIAVDSPQPGYVFLSDAYYPGWQATVNGQPAPLYRANYAFRAIPVPAGESLVVLRFAPLSWRLGLALSGLTVLGVLGWLGRFVGFGRVG